MDGGALLIMDILVELQDGSLANVEVQKVPYLVPVREIGLALLLCHSKNKPPAMQGEGKSLDISNTPVLK